MRIILALVATAVHLSTTTATETDSSCGSSTSCSSCLAKSGCTWFGSIGYCETGCGMDGCGATKCASEISNCWDCLSTGAPAFGQYAWSPSSGTNGACIASCMDAPADASCYPGKNPYNPYNGYESKDCNNIVPPPTCASYGGNCKKCLKNDCAWSVGECHEDCMSAPADAACWQGQSAKRNRDSICSSEGEVAFA
ncbi:hypothetical protein ACHAXS_012440 [Conticribra weissflogii]